MNYARAQDVEATPYYQVLAYGLMVDRTTLYERINRRVDWMLSQGLMEETRTLLERGVPREHKVMNTIGYRHMLQVIDGVLEWEEAVRLMKRDTRRYAKRQYTWFKRDDRIQWLKYDGEEDKALALATLDRGIRDFF
jgi:tRNA dimethylallyltransferase